MCGICGVVQVGPDPLREVVRPDVDSSRMTDCDDAPRAERPRRRTRLPASRSACGA